MGTARSKCWVCGKRFEGSGRYCERHACETCRTVGGQCLSHTCRKPLCRRRVDTPGYCGAHPLCAFGGCQINVDEEGDFCFQAHGCAKRNCARARLAGGDGACRLHVCAEAECTRVIGEYCASGRTTQTVPSKWCPAHGCRYCSDARGCSKHHCQYRGCELAFRNGTAGCKHHACEAPSCPEPIQDESARCCAAHSTTEAEAPLHVPADTKTVAVPPLPEPSAPARDPDLPPERSA